MKLFKNRTFDKDEFEEFVIGCGTASFVIAWFVLCICFRYVAYFTGGLLFIVIPLILLFCAIWHTFNMIFPKKVDVERELKELNEWLYRAKNAPKEGNEEND